MLVQTGILLPSTHTRSARRTLKLDGVADAVAVEGLPLPPPAVPLSLCDCVDGSAEPVEVLEPDSVIVDGEPLPPPEPPSAEVEVAMGAVPSASVTVAVCAEAEADSYL